MRKILTSLILLVVVLVGCTGLGGLPLDNPVGVKSSTTTAAVYALESGSYQLYFTKQGDGPDQALVSLFDSATTTIDVAIYSLTYPSIVTSLVSAKKRGVVVRVVTDESQVGGKSQKAAANTLLIVGIPVKKDDHSGLMHLKMSIVDSRVATTGSYNYTASATKSNDEMLMVVQDSNFVTLCQEEFNRIWNDSAHYVQVEPSF